MDVEQIVKKILFTLMIMLLPIMAMANVNLGIKKADEFIVIPLLTLDSAGVDRAPDSIQILTWLDGGTGLQFSASNTTYPFDGISVDTSKIFADTTYWFVEQIQDIDGTPTPQNYSLAIDVITWTKVIATHNRATVQVISDSLEVWKDSTLANIIDGGFDDGKFASGAITSAVFATDAITGLKIAPNAIGASEFEITAVDKIWEHAVSSITNALGIGRTLRDTSSAIFANQTLIIDSLQAVLDSLQLQDDWVLAKADTSGGANYKEIKSIQNNTITALSIAAAAFNGKGDWNIGKTGYALTLADWNVGKTGYSLTLADWNVGKTGYSLLDAQWENVYFDIDTANVDTSKIGEWLVNNLSGAAGGLDTLETSFVNRLLSLIADSNWLSPLAARDGVAGSFGDSAQGWGATAAGGTDTLNIKTMMERNFTSASGGDGWANMLADTTWLLDTTGNKIATGFGRILGAVLDTLNLQDGWVAQEASLFDFTVDSVIVDGSSLAATADAITATTLAASAALEIADTVWDEVLTNATHNVTQSSGQRVRHLEDLVVTTEGTAQSGTATSITLASGTSFPDGVLDGNKVTLIGGTGDGQTRHIETWTDATDVATLHHGDDWAVNPDATSEYIISPFAPVDVSHINDSALSDIWNFDTTAVTVAGGIGMLLRDTLSAIIDTLQNQDDYVLKLADSAEYMNVKSISGDATAADNLETMLDGTGGQILSLGQLRVEPTTAQDTGIVVIAVDNGEGVFISSAGTGSALVAYAKGTGHGIHARTDANGLSGLFAQGGGNGAHGFTAVGNGTGDGFRAQAGATGDGLVIAGGGTSGNAISTSVTSGREMDLSLTQEMSSVFADTNWLSLLAARDGVAGSFGDSAQTWGNVTVATNSDKTGYTLTAAEWEKVWFDIDTLNVDSSKIGEWLVNNLAVAGALSAADIVAIADTIFHRDSSDVNDGGAASFGTLLMKPAYVQGSASLTKEEIADAVLDTMEAGTRQINYRSFTVDSGTVFAAAATGQGFTISGGATSGDGMNITATDGDGVDISSGTNGHALRLLGAGTGEGISSFGGTSGGGAVFVGGASGSAGIAATGGGGGAGMNLTGGATGNGLTIVGGGTSGDAMNLSATDGDGIDVSAGTNGTGLLVIGAGTGNGATFTSGGGSSAHGVKMQSVATNGHGLNLDGSGTGDGLYAVGGGVVGGNGMEIEGGASGGFGVYINAPDSHAVLIEGSTNAAAWGAGVELRGGTGANSTGDGLKITGGFNTGLSDGAGAGDGIDIRTNSDETDDFAIEVDRFGTPPESNWLLDSSNFALNYLYKFWAYNDSTAPNLENELTKWMVNNLAGGGGSGLDTLETAFVDRLTGRIADTNWLSLLEARDGVAGSFGDSSQTWGAAGGGGSLTAAEVADTFDNRSGSIAGLVTVDVAGGYIDSNLQGISNPNRIFTVVVIDSSGTDELIPGADTDLKNAALTTLQKKSGSPVVFSVNDATFTLVTVAGGFTCDTSVIAVTGNQEDTVYCYNTPDPGAAAGVDFVRAYIDAGQTHIDTLTGAPIPLKNAKFFVDIVGNPIAISGDWFIPPITYEGKTNAAGRVFFDIPATTKMTPDGIYYLLRYEVRVNRRTVKGVLGNFVVDSLPDPLKIIEAINVWGANE